MRANKEIRRTAREILRNRWFWRLLLVALVLYSVQNLVLSFLGEAYAQCGIARISEYVSAWMSTARQGLDFSLPNSAARFKMAGGALFESFISYIFAAIAAYGMTNAVLRSTADRVTGWFAASLDGFRRPLELAWLMFVMNLFVFLWSLLLVIPGIIALYRYRLAWYLKAENPEWSARRCLSESKRLMKGLKGRAFLLDLSFVWWLLLGGAAMGLAIGLTQVSSKLFLLLAIPLSLGAIMLMIWVLVYVFVARAVFYNEVKGEVE